MANFGIELARSHPRAIAAALHPGTVISALSAPFRQSKPDNSLFTPDEAEQNLLGVIAQLSPVDSGGLFG